LIQFDNRTIGAAAESSESGQANFNGFVVGKSGGERKR